MEGTSTEDTSRNERDAEGVLLYEMLTGRWPFRGKTAVDVRYGVLHEISIADGAQAFHESSTRAVVLETARGRES